MELNDTLGRRWVVQNDSEEVPDIMLSPKADEGR